MQPAFWPPAHVQFFESLRLYYQSADCLCTHGGLNPRVGSIHEQTRHDLIWGAASFPDKYTGSEPIVYGHRNNAVMDAAGWPLPAIVGRTMGIDTISHGVLTAVRLPDGPGVSECSTQGLRVTCPDRQQTSSRSLVSSKPQARQESIHPFASAQLSSGDLKILTHPPECIFVGICLGLRCHANQKQHVAIGELGGREADELPLSRHLRHIAERCGESATSADAVASSTPATCKSGLDRAKPRKSCSVSCCRLPVPCVTPTSTPCVNAVPPFA